MIYTIISNSYNSCITVAYQAFINLLYTQNANSAFQNTSCLKRQSGYYATLV